MYDTRYTDIVNYDNYLLEVEMQQREMNDYINECLILSNNRDNPRKAIQELAVFNEGKIGDKFKQIWARVKSFFSKIYQKFLEKLSAWGSDKSAYLKDYKDIILGKKITVSGKMMNHFEGMKRFTEMQTKLSSFAKAPTVDELKNIGAKGKEGIESAEKGNESVDAYTLSQQEAVSKIFSSDLYDKDDPSGYGARCTAYFNGGTEINEFSSDELQDKIQIMYNFCYQYDSLVESLNKVKNAFDKGMDEFEASYKKGYDAIKKETVAQIKNTADGKTTDAAQNAKNITSTLDKLRQEADKAKQEAYSFVYGKVITEAEVVSSSGGSGSSGSVNSTVKSGGNNNTAVAKDDTANATAARANRTSGTSTANTTKSDFSKSKPGAEFTGAKSIEDNISSDNKTEEKLNQYETNCIGMIKAFASARTLIMGGALNALTTTRKDYFDIIRGHVQSYVGQINNAEDNTTNINQGNGKIS